MSGYKEWVNNEKITHTDINAYLTQGVLRFTTTTARDAAITAPVEGMFAYLQTPNLLTWYNGAAWQVVSLSRTAYKTSDTSRASTTTVTDDPHLTLSVVADGVYRAHLDLFANSASVTPDLKTEFTGPTGATFLRGAVGAGTAVTDRTAVTSLRMSAHLIGTSVTYGLDGTGSGHYISETGIVIVSSTAGSITLQWAQNTSNATATVVSAGSMLTLVKIA